MGKGTIIGGGKDGLYQLNVDYGDQKRWQLIAQIDARIIELNAAVATAETNYNNQKNIVSEKESELNGAISALNAFLSVDPSADATIYLDAVKKKTNEYQEEVKKLKPFLYARETLKSERTNLQNKRNGYANLKLIETKNAWCADFTENAQGQVATIEVPGEPKQVIIAPGGTFPQKTDGQVLARELMTPEQAFTNAALLPGWQKFKPTFRIGTIVDIKATGATVNVRYEESTAQNLKINQSASLTNVPFKYMDCDAAAFAVGDEVLIKFEGQNWKQPKIIGFSKNPKQCQKLLFNGGVYRGWGTFDTGGDNKPNVVFRDTYFILRTPLSLHKEFWAAANNEIVCTFTNPYWGAINLGVIDQYAEYFGEKSLAITGNFTNTYLKYKTVYFGDGTPTQVYEEIRISIGTFWRDEEALNYPYYLLSPCNDPYLFVAIEEYPLWGSLIAGHDFAYWESAMSGPIQWNMFLSIKDKVIFSGDLTTYPQPLYPYYYGYGSVYPPGEPGKGPLDDAYVCTYTGERRPSPTWKWSGGGIAIPPEVTWIQKI